MEREKQNRSSYSRNKERRDRYRDGYRTSNLPTSRDAAVVTDPSSIHGTEPLTVQPVPDVPIAVVSRPRLPRINVNKLNWESRHSLICKRGCRKESVHYVEWRNAYYPHLWDLYATFCERINSSKVSFHLFAEFVYRTSSGYISEFA